MNQIIRRYRDFRDWFQGRELADRQRELTGALLARQVRALGAIGSLREAEFRVHSQFGDDGIIQWLVSRLPGLPRTFVEFGVEDYSEATTRFLLVNDNWTGLVMDGDPGNIEALRRRPWFWRHDLSALSLFLTAENVDAAIGDWAKDRAVGLLHIDVDGNDYWLWNAIGCVRPGIVIVEYNAVFGPERALTIPYHADFDRLRAHHSGQYFGASLAALAQLGAQKGYGLLGTNSAGNNAYFLRRDLFGKELVERPVRDAFTPPSFRESRTVEGKLDYASLADRMKAIAGLPVMDVLTGRTEAFRP